MRPIFLLFLLTLVFSITYGQEEKMYWIDRSGDPIDPMEDYTDTDVDGVALYREAQKFGFKNSAGEIKLEARYDLAMNLGKGFTAFAYKVSGEDVVWYMFNKTGKMIHGSPFKNILAMNASTTDKPVFSNGKILVQRISDSKFGCIDSTGHFALPELYDYIKDLGDPVMYIGKEGQHGLYTKKSGQEILTKYDEIKEFSQGLAAVSKKGKWGYINYEGKEVIPAKFLSAGYFINGQASGVKDAKTGEEKTINLKGEFVTPAGALQVASIYETVLVVKNSNNLYAIADRVSGKTVTDFIFTNAPIFTNGYTSAITKDNKGVLLNRKGETVLKGYDAFGVVSEGLVAAVKTEVAKDKSGKELKLESCGYVDLTGKVIIPFHFGGTGVFRNGLAKVVEFNDYKTHLTSK